MTNLETSNIAAHIVTSFYVYGNKKVDENGEGTVF